MGISFGGKELNRLFRVKNTSSAFWITAPDLETARQIAVQKRYVRNPANIILVGDQTDTYLNQPGGENLRSLLEIPAAQGIACHTLPRLTFADILSGVDPPHERHWLTTTPEGQTFQR